ncbi:MAG: hypothetical protein J6Y24_01710 [Bacteroidales bacterium]|nr:hypothetical protein [Bacteroidales bacterium]
MKGTKISLEAELKNCRNGFLVLWLISLGIVGCGLLMFLKSADTLYDCSYTEGMLEERNNYYKTLTLKWNHKPFDYNIPCAKYSSNIYFKGFNDELFEKINLFLTSDSTEHFIQIWFQTSNYVGKGVGTAIAFKYYQIIIDGTIIKSFDKWERKKKAIIAMIVGTILFVILIILYIKARNKIKQELL